MTSLEYAYIMRGILKAVDKRKLTKVEANLVRDIEAEIKKVIEG